MSRQPDLSVSGILEPRTVLSKKPSGEVMVRGRKQPHSVTVGIDASKTQPLQADLQQLRVSVDAQGHDIKVLRQERGPCSLTSHTLSSSQHEVPAGEVGNRRAMTALADLQARLGLASGVSDEQASELEQESERTKTSWIRDGLLVSSATFSLSWSRSRQALEQACARGTLFSLKIGNNRWYPKSLTCLSAEDVKAVCLLLKGVDPVSQFIFWERKHGSLGGQTLPQALHAGKKSAVLRTAEVFASEQSARVSAA